MSKKCLSCGKLFESKGNQKYCHRLRTAICPTCGKEFTYECCSNHATHCSIKCGAKDPKSIEKVRKTQFAKYGSMGFNTEKQRETNLKRYGSTSPAKNHKVKEKIKKTQLAKHNGKYAFNTDKQKETMLKKYGSYGRLGNPKELKKQKEIMLKRYGVNTPSKLPKFENKIINTLIKKNGTIFNTNGGVVSTNNKNFANELIKRFNVKVEFEHQVENSSFDLYIPNKNLAIELNPTVTHNSTIPFACLREGCKQPCTKHKGISNNYHYNRAMLAKKHGIKLIQIYDWDNQEKIFNMLSQRLLNKTIKLSAHKTILKSIKQKEANAFLNDYHIQGGSRNQKYCYGLYYNNGLLAVATFGLSRFKSKAEYEFIRFAVKKGYTLFGAPDKMFKQFIRDANPKSVISYIDFNHTTTDTFLPHMGFVETQPTGPREVWTKKGTTKKVPITTLLAIGADRVLGTNYGSPKKCGMNNVQIMEKEGWVKIYTAGNRIFIWKNKENA